MMTQHKKRKAGGSTSPPTKSLASKLASKSMLAGPGKIVKKAAAAYKKSKKY